MALRHPALAALTALAFLSPAVAPAQDPAPADPTFGESVEVRVINVDVFVTDRDGRPVQGLAREDFEVLEDGKRQEVTNFYRVEGPRVQADGQGGWDVITADSSFRRRVMLLLDNNFITTPERDNALAVLQGYLDQKFDSSYEWGVVAVGDEVRVLEPFTSDKLRVRAALDRIREMPTFASRYRVSRFFLNDPVRVRRAEREEAAMGSGGRAGDGQFQRSLRFESKFNVAATLGAFERTSAAMVQSFRAYSNLPGNKILIWVTGGVPMLPEYGFPGDAGAGKGSISSQDRELREYQTELRELVDSIAWEANAAQFKVYPIKATGLENQIPQSDVGYRSSGSSIASETFSAPVEIDDGDSAQLSVALGTGGLYLTSNRTMESFESIDRDTTAYYSLGYSPTRSEDGELHKVRVEVRKPGLVVRSRSGFVDLSPEKRLEMVLATPLPFPREKGRLPVRIEIARSGASDVLATVKVSNSLLTFVPQGDLYHGRVKVYLTIHDQIGNLVDLLSEEKDLQFPLAQHDDVLAGEFRYGLKFRLKDKGSYVVSITLRDVATDEIGTAFTNVEI